MRAARTTCTRLHGLPQSSCPAGSGRLSSGDRHDLNRRSSHGDGRRSPARAETARGLSDRVRTLELESWVRLRFRLASSDPTSHIIAATARLTEAGMSADEAVDTVLRIADEVNREVSDG